MSERLYALLVGINQYPSDVGRLYGCVNDVEHLHDYLRTSGNPRTLAVETLKDAQATRADLVRAFRQHLGQARPGDVALFHYSGHGARWSSAVAFREFYPEGKDEGLVCIDSRSPGGYDLADKELAVLVEEVAQRGVHLVVMLDCCHSGSGTRNADAFRGLRSRVTHEVFDERPLESYLNGHFARLQAQGQPLHLPTGRHILLAACERTQQAKETADNRGVFTSTLLEVLRKSGGALPYAELFVRCRAAVRTRADDQLPQFETYGHFNAWSGFLGRNVSHATRRYSVAFDKNEWRADCGAVHGVPTDPERHVELALYAEDRGDTPAGTARVVQVGAQRSVVELDFEPDTAARFRAELSTLPVSPLWVWIQSGSSQQTALQRALEDDASVGVSLTDISEAARYLVTRHDGRLVVTLQGSSDVIQAVHFDDQSPEAAMPPLLSVLAHVAQWERSLALANPASHLDAAAIDLVCIEPSPEGSADERSRHAGSEVVLESLREGQGSSASWADVHAKLQARNRSGQRLHLLLLHFSQDYGVQKLFNESVPSGDDWVTLFGAAPDDFFWVDAERGEVESVDRFKLLVSTEKLDDFLLSQDPLERGQTRAISKALGRDRRIGSKVKGEEWLTRDLRVRTVRRLDELGSGDWVSPNGRITLKGNPVVTASISLAAPPPASRGVSGNLPFQLAFARAGMELLNFGATRGGADSVLELTNIQHADQLREHPLELLLDVTLADDEGILPFIFDGLHVIPAGQPSRDNKGRSHVTIDHLYELPVERRSVGKALKLYFFKTYLRRNNVNRLCWVDYQDDGSFKRRREGVADRVAQARRVLVLVHGIIGDTEGMAAGIRACGIDSRFDLVLTYDFENLSTPIVDTARLLKADLAGVGLEPQNGRELTLLVHSMGGLVARWFVEREGGGEMVDHLVMCGTPNQGSPFGKVDDARKIITTLVGLAANVAPALVPYLAPLLFVLNRTLKVTPTLEQMDPGSDFIRELNRSPDPGVRYTVIAGNVHEYEEPSDPAFAQLVFKIGRGTLFDLLFAQRPNDIAVSVDSIMSGAPARAHASKQPVACHHLNYFSSRAGQVALTAVPW